MGGPRAERLIEFGRGGLGGVGRDPPPGHAGVHERCEAPRHGCAVCGRSTTGQVRLTPQCQEALTAGQAQGTPSDGGQPTSGDHVFTL